MSQIITPRTMSGFRDYLPDLMLAREKVLDATRRVYRSYGFTPIDTPACESLDILLGKGGDESDKLVYRVQSAKSEKVEMGLRFDLTVPFARFAAQYINQLGTPFKRYAMGPVWRGERPGHGRYREFWQCDFDTIGTTSNAADIETVMVINDLFEAIGFDKFEIRINNRVLLNGLFEVFGLSEKGTEILRAIDKLQKIGEEGVKKELSEVNDRIMKEAAKKIEPIINNLVNNKLLTGKDRLSQFADAILRSLGVAGTILAASVAAQNEVKRLAIDLDKLALSSPTPPSEDQLRDLFLSEAPAIPDRYIQILLSLMKASGSNIEILDRIYHEYGINQNVAFGVSRLRELLTVVKTAGIPEGRIKIDLSIARGLDYYTGTIYETFLTDLPGIGSVCSGGRYDNLASKYTKQVLPGVGASLGLDRLIAAMEELKHPLLSGQSTPAEVLVVQFDAARLGDYERIARSLRKVGIAVEVYPDAKKVGVQLAYAEKRGFKLALIAGAAEFEQGVWKLKDLAKREEVTVSESELIRSIRNTNLH